ncbi:glycoside hydrolase family 76 protein [Terracidiphilus gabretensis]|uniref:glycoside hydrolase family 76 protein n=1 Tax=Terracidiphilus gabretensis TaxID=1577687 RepID=UPI00071B8479|nr:glycoside hydrolase family 76 protein [Terracidiphilus gabretensis]
MRRIIKFCPMQLKKTLLQGPYSQLFRFLTAIFLLSSLSLPQPIWGQAATTTLPLSPSDWSLAYSGQDASLSSVTYAGQPSLQWQVTSALGHSDWVSDTLSLPTDELYTFTVQLAGTGTATLNIWNGEANVTSAPIQLSSTFQTVSETVAVLSPNPQFQILDPDSTTSAVNVYFTKPSVSPVGPASGLPLWQTAYGGQDSTLTSTTYNDAPALEWQVDSALGHSDWIYTYAPLLPGNTYQISAQVAGSGTVEINAWDGNENVSGPPVTLTPNFQTITETVLALAPNTVVVSPSTPQFQLVDPAINGSSALTLYFQNVTWKQVPPTPMPPTGVSAQQRSGDNVKVDWSAPAQCSGAGLPTITGYDVYVTAQPFAENYSRPSATVSGCGSGATSAIVQVPGGRAVGNWILYATVVATSAEGNSSPSPQVSTVQLTGDEGEAQAAVQELQTYYDPSTGLFNTTGWWNSANALDAVIDYMERTGSRAYMSDVSNTFTKAVNEAPPPTPGNFIDTAYDDTQWWALTWVNAYKLTRNPAYLQMAEKIHSYVTQAWTPSQCGGGLIWQTTNAYQNSVTNELFLELSARLYLETHQVSYLQWAQKELAWFNASGLINSSNLINDGLTTSCQNNGQTTWTYNQGVILGGLTALYQATNDQTYLTEARRIANAAISTLVSSNGILTEPCGSPCPSQNPDQTQFKGIFVRNLDALYQVTGDQTYLEFIDRNASSIWENDRNIYDQIGFDWAGPITAPDQSFNASTLSSGLDALNAAAHARDRQHPHENLFEDPQ